jgi:hypothetical protein
VRVGLDLAIRARAAFLPIRAFGAGGPMARRTFDVVDIIDYAARRIMRREPALAGGAGWPAGVLRGEHAA